MPEIHSGLITYCTNIHPGEGWEDTFDAIREHIPAVKQRVSPSHPFPIGLRLSYRAATELSAAGTTQFSNWLVKNDCFIPTINGFPYGSFHGMKVKESVYLPDWRSSERSAYTMLLADLLSELLPDKMAGSISTVPIGFKGIVSKDDYPTVKEQLTEVLIHLSRIHAETGKMIVLALEPEPGCLLETTKELCTFWSDMAFPPHLRKHLGICLDCCHQAVEFEDPAETLRVLHDFGIRIAKVQISSALKISGKDADLLSRFIEPVYLHQVVVRSGDGSFTRYPDLPDALAGHRFSPEDEWRCHFHIPIFQDDFGLFGTTRGYIEGITGQLPGNTLFEVETYTWDVLPPELRSSSVIESIIRELIWLKEQLNAAHRCS